MGKPRDHRQFLIYYARVLLLESAARRGKQVNNPFHWDLFAWAQKARREAAAAPRNEQLSMFGGAGDG
jgi:hypothetical protein